MAREWCKAITIAIDNERWDGKGKKVAGGRLARERQVSGVIRSHLHMPKPHHKQQHSRVAFAHSPRSRKQCCSVPWLLIDCQQENCTFTLTWEETADYRVEGDVRLITSWRENKRESVYYTTSSTWASSRLQWRTDGAVEYGWAHIVSITGLLQEWSSCWWL